MKMHLIVYAEEVLLHHGKYISEPELAREDLRVLCLNCNEIRQPQVQTEPKKPKSQNKKSRYFPR